MTSTVYRALRNATPFPIPEELIVSCVDLASEADAGFAVARSTGLAKTKKAQRPPGLARVTGEVDEQHYSLFWQITTPGMRGVDLLRIAPDERVVALEVKGTLRPGAIPRLTPSRLRQMSRDWLNDPSNPGIADWTTRPADSEDHLTRVLVARVPGSRLEYSYAAYGHIRTCLSC